MEEKLHYEKGEKNNKHFLNLKKSNKEKSCVRKILKSDGTITVNPKSIMSELESFYSNLHKESNRLPPFFLDDLNDFPTLTEKTLLKLQFPTPFKVFQISKWPAVMWHQSLDTWCYPLRI